MYIVLKIEKPVDKYFVKHNCIANHIHESFKRENFQNFHSFMITMRVYYSCYYK